MRIFKEVNGVGVQMHKLNEELSLPECRSYELQIMIFLLVHHITYNCKECKYMR